MSKVKGSREYQYRVVKYRPLIWGIFAAAVVVGCVLIGQGGYWLGYKYGVSGQEMALTDLTAVSTQLESTREETETLKQQLANARLGAEVDQGALEVVRTEVTGLKERLASLEEENQFYRNLMAPSGNKRGLTFGAAEITETETPRTFRYKVVMQQLASQHSVLHGTLSFNIVGHIEGNLKVFALKDLSPTVASTNLKLRFKYFQNIEGELTLPEGFDPERIELEARSTGKKPVTIEKRLGWLVQQHI